MASEMVPPGNGKPLDQHHRSIDTRTSVKTQQTATSPKVIVAIPAFNEEVAVGSVVLRSIKYADEVIVVDDGSKDQTAEVARLAGAEVIVHEKNGGYGAAIKTCFETAKKHDADIMIIIDADGQHNPNDIPCLIKEMLDSKADIVIGSRFVNGNGKNQKIPTYRKFGMKVLDTATNVSTGLHISDSQSGFRAYSRTAIKSITLDNQDMGAGSEILVCAAENHLKIMEIPIRVRYDLESTSSKSPLSHGLGVLNNIVKLISQKRPLLFFCLPGTSMMGIGTLCAFLLVSAFNIQHILVVEYALGAMLFVLLGMILVSTGLMLYSIRTLRSS